MREFLAQNQVDHRFHDVRKAPIPGAKALALVRRHARALVKKGHGVVAVDPGSASDAELRKLFLGREGMLRAPTLSDGDTVFAGFDEATLRALTGG
ncbi:MAG: hypothetical protein NVS2B9_08980 [Myxococcales bacterium]